MIFEALLQDHIAHLGEGKNKDGTYSSNLFIPLALTCKILHKELRDWRAGKAKLRQAICCGLFDPDTTVFCIDFGFLAQNKHLPSLVLGRHPSFQNCSDPIWLRIADPTWLRIMTAWGDVNLLDNIRHLQIDVGSLSASVSQKEIRDPSLLLFSLFWNHFAKPRRLHRLDIKLDVSQLHYKLDWRSVILADIWVWLELCRWQVLINLCTCDPPRAPKSLAIRYHDTGRMEDQNA